MKYSYHSGELLAQQLAGERAEASRNEAIIGNTIMASALPFLRQQQMLIVGSNSPQGQTWSSILFGPVGFLESEDGKTLRIRLQPETFDCNDPFWSNILTDRRLGGLAIELATRRRLRINGRVIDIQPGLLTVAVEEAYPNCPKYIQRRLLKPAPTLVAEQSRTESGSILTDNVREIVQTADTLFVASSNPGGGVDVSHRGGHPGFAAVLDEHNLSVPDYQGNGMSNTLGNLLLNPAGGILIVDFAKGRTLQLTGTARIHWPQAEGSHTAGHIGRSWTFSVERWLQRPLSVSVEWQFLDFSPFNPGG